MLCGAQQLAAQVAVEGEWHCEEENGRPNEDTIRVTSTPPGWSMMIALLNVVMVLLF